MINQKNYSTLQNVLPMVAGDIRAMKIGIIKLVNLQSNSPKDKAKDFFDKQAQKESLLESKLGKMGGSSPTRSSGGAGGAGGTKLFSIGDFIKNIANMLIKGALVALGTFGLAKLLDNDEVRKTIKDFVSKMFFTILEVIQKGAGLLTEFFKENGPAIREAIIKTFQAIVKLLVTAIESTADLLADKRIYEGLVEIIQAIYAGIKKVLSTKINIGGEEVTLGVVIGAVIVAFGVLKGSIYFLKLAADAAAKSLLGIDGGKSRKDIPTGAPQGGDKGGDKSGPQSKQERTRAGKESLERIANERMAQEAKDLAKATIVANAVVGSVVAVGTTLSVGAALNLSGMSADELEMLSNSGGGDDTAFAAAITNAGKGPTKASATPAVKPTAPKQTPAKDPFKEAMIKGANKASAVAPGDMEKGLLDLISEGESASAGNYNAMNQGSIGKQILGSGNSEKIIGKKLTEMTIGEIMQRGKKNVGDGERVFAAGRYQIIPSTLKGLVDAGLVNANDKFDEATQDKLGMALLQKRGLNRYKSGEISAEEFQNSLALEWASIANTSGTTSLGGPNVAMKGSGAKLAALLSGKGGTPTPALASASTNVTEKPGEDKPKSMIESLFDQLAVLDKFTGGALNLSSINVNDLVRDLDKQMMDNPMFIDNSVNTSGGEDRVMATTASVWDQGILDTILNQRTT